MINVLGSIQVVIGEAQPRYCEDLVIVNSFTRYVQCVTIRADRPHAIDQGNTSFSSARRKPLPEPFVSTADDSGHHHLCVPKGPGRTVTNHFDVTKPKRIELANLAGVPSEIDAACQKLTLNQTCTTAVNKSGIIIIIIIINVCQMTWVIPKAGSENMLPKQLTNNSTITRPKHKYKNNKINSSYNNINTYTKAILSLKIKHLRATWNSLGLDISKTLEGTLFQWKGELTNK